MEIMNINKAQIQLLYAASMLSLLASCLIYAQALLEYVIFIMWLHSVIKMLLCVKSECTSVK